MKNLIFMFLVLLTGYISIAQPSVNDFINGLTSTNKSFTECAAVFLNGDMLVNEYSPKGTCKISKDTKGFISLSAVNLDEKGGTPTKSLPFKVAIKNSKTGTLWMFSDETMESLYLEDVLEKCEKGDKILILTLDSIHSLPHNEIEIVEGC